MRSIRDKTLKDRTTKNEVSVDRNYCIMDFTFKPQDVTAVYHDEEDGNVTFVTHNGNTTCIPDPNKQLFDFCNSFMKPIFIEREEDPNENENMKFEDYREDT